MSDVYRDAQKALLALIAGPVAFAVALLLAVGWFGYCAGQRTIRDNRIVALRDTLRITDSVIVARTDTVTKYQRRVDTVRSALLRIDTLIQIAGDSTLTIRDPLKDSTKNLNVPAVLVADLRQLRLTIATQDTLIRALYGKDSTQEWRIVTRDKLYTLELAKAHGPRWGYGVTLGYGCGERCGPVVAVGLSYQAPLPNWKRLFLKAAR